MNRYAHIKNGVVTNISNWDGVTPFDPGEGVTMILVDENARIGGTYDGGFHYVEPARTAEELAREASVESAKAKLLAIGLTVDEVREAFGI
tara:strand:+ start:449 stop:721 length:273 start_codon:yes stop_codon:yes gene_type:complete